MKFIDITTDKETLYTLKKDEQCVFFLLNRSGDISFELQGEHAAAHIFAFFNGAGTERRALTISQKHLAPQTVSHALVKSILKDEATFTYRGTISIGKDAVLSDASQENRNLLLSPSAQAFSEPALEILNNDVRCHHAASTSPLNQETLFFAEARGLSPKQAETLLISGFFRSSINALGELVSSQEKEKVLALMGQVTPLSSPYGN